MEIRASGSPWQRLGWAILQCVLFVLVLPLGTALCLDLSPLLTLALISSTLVIEYGAAPVGIALGLPPAFVLFVIVIVALGVILLLFALFEILGERSERIARFLKNARTRVTASPFLTRYGIYGIVPGVILLGIYVCPPVSWVLGWRRDHAIILMMAGYVAVSLFTILISTGIIHLITGGY